MLRRHLDTSGRIGRGEFWLAVVKTILIVFLALVVLLALDRTINIRPALNKGSNLAVYAPSLLTGIVGAVILNAVWFFCLLPPSIRRRHDRGGSGLDVKLLAVLQIFLMIGGLGLLPSGILYIEQIGSTAGSLYLFVVLGLLPGERRTNSFGPDPRAESRAASVAAAGE